MTSSGHIETEQFGWFQCVSFAGKHRLICNITYQGHDVTLRDLEPRSKFDVDLLRSACMYFDASR